jgi:hypothetical protein
VGGAGASHKSGISDTIGTETVKMVSLPGDAFRRAGG